MNMDIFKIYWKFRIIINGVFDLSVPWLTFLIDWFLLLFYGWTKEVCPVHRWQCDCCDLSPLSPLIPLPPSLLCFPSCECGRHWSVEAYNDARRDPRAWTLDENLFGVSECQEPTHPAVFFLFFLLLCPSSPCVCVASMFLPVEITRLCPTHLYAALWKCVFSKRLQHKALIPTCLWHVLWLPCSLLIFM